MSFSHYTVSRKTQTATDNTLSLFRARNKKKHTQNKSNCNTKKNTQEKNSKPKKFKLTQPF